MQNHLKHVKHDIIQAIHMNSPYFHKFFFPLFLMRQKYRNKIHYIKKFNRVGRTHQINLLRTKQGLKMQLSVRMTAKQAQLCGFYLYSPIQNRTKSEQLTSFEKNWGKKKNHSQDFTIFYEEYFIITSVKISPKP